MKAIVTTTLLVVAFQLMAPAASSAQRYYDPYYQDGPRFRFGAEIGAGFWPKDDLGLALTALPSIGVQFNDLLGLVAVTGITMGGFTDRASPDLEDKIGWLNGMGLIDFTLANGIQIGGGGGVDYGDFGICEDGGQVCQIRRNARGAVHGRLALVPGWRGNRGRFGFPIAAHYHAPFIDGKPQHQLLFTFGFQRF
jgi:hypothetical protein